MDRRLFIQSLTGAVACASSLGARALMASDKPLIMGIFPRRNAKQTHRAFTPMALYLEQMLGRPVELVVSRKFPEFWEGVKSGRFDITHFNQYHYLLARKFYGYRVILKNQEFGADSFASAIFTRKDSGLSTLEDLRGKTILFGGGKRAMLSYIVPTWMLRNAGLNEGDYVEKIALNPPNAVISTYHGQADAAGAGESIGQIKMVKKSLDMNQFKYLVRSEKLTHLPWAVRNDMSVELQVKIQTILSGLNEHIAGRSILQGAQLTALTLATDADYTYSEKIVRELYGKNYGESSK